MTFVTVQVSSTHSNLEKYDQGKLNLLNGTTTDGAHGLTHALGHLVLCMDALTSLHDSVLCKSVYIKVAWRDITNVQYQTLFVIQLTMPVCVSLNFNHTWLEEK